MEMLNAEFDQFMKARAVVIQYESTRDTDL
jgi:hypothetical protein